MVMTRLEARSRLRAHGVGSDAAKRALANGLAGDAMHAGGRVLFHTAAVEELARRPCIDPTDVGRLSPRGLFVARREVPLSGTWSARSQVVAAGWASMSPWHLVSLRVDVAALGPLPVIATTGGFVTFGADAVDVVPQPHDGRQLVLDVAGPWFAAFEGRRLRGGPGRPWDVYRPWSRTPESLARGRIAG